MARQAGVSRATLYRGHPRLKQQFEQQIAQAAAGGQHRDPRDDRLQERLDVSQLTTAGLLEFQQLALSRLTAQHQEIVRLRAARTPVGVGDLVSARADRTAKPR